MISILIFLTMIRGNKKSYKYGFERIVSKCFQEQFLDTILITSVKL